VTKDEELQLVERVGRELAKLGLKKHVARAREYYAAVRDGRPCDVWSRGLTVEWARMLRLPPHENDYPVRPRMSPCHGCEASRTFTAAVWPGGSLHQCDACGSRWICLDE
jgi:hypothetical protein